jgi:hypothetical protein
MALHTFLESLGYLSGIELLGGHDTCATAVKMLELFATKKIPLLHRNLSNIDVQTQKSSCKRIANQTISATTPLFSLHLTSTFFKSLASCT